MVRIAGIGRTSLMVVFDNGGGFCKA